MGPTAARRPLPPQHLAFGVSVLGAWAGRKVQEETASWCVWICFLARVVAISLEGRNIRNTVWGIKQSHGLQLTHLSRTI